MVSWVVDESSEELISNHELKVPNNLHRLILDGKLREATARCRNFPSEAAQWREEYDDQGEVTYRRLPIHEACILLPEEGGELIAALMEVHPMGVREVDHSDRFPLHQACFYGATPVVVNKLVMSFPEAVAAKDVWGKTPYNVAEGSTSQHRRLILNAVSHSVEYYLFKKESEVGAREKKLRDEVEAHKRKILELEDKSKRNKDEIHTLKWLAGNADRMEHQIKLLEDECEALRLKNKESGITVTPEESREMLQALQEKKDRLEAEKRQLRDKADGCDNLQQIIHEAKDRMLHLEERTSALKAECEYLRKSTTCPKNLALALEKATERVKRAERQAKELEVKCQTLREQKAKAKERQEQVHLEYETLKNEFALMEQSMMKAMEKERELELTREKAVKAEADAKRLDFLCKTLQGENRYIRENQKEMEKSNEILSKENKSLKRASTLLEESVMEAFETVKVAVEKERALEHCMGGFVKQFSQSEDFQDSNDEIP